MIDPALKELGGFGGNGGIGLRQHLSPIGQVIVTSARYLRRPQTSQRPNARSHTPRTEGRSIRRSPYPRNRRNHGRNR